MSKKKKEKSLEIISNEKYPIIVTRALPRKELNGWEDFLKDRGIKVRCKRVGEKRDSKGRRFIGYELRRKVTDRELEEIMEGKWWIGGGSFRKVEFHSKRQE